MRMLDNSASYTTHRWPRPAGARPTHIIVHDPGNDRAGPASIVRFLQRNAAQVCYHRLLWQDHGGEVHGVVLAPWHEWVGHAGVATRIPRTGIVNGRVNHWTVSLSVCTYGRPTLPGTPLFDALADQAATAIRQLGMPDAGVVLAHREVNTVPGRRTDPRGVDMDQLRAAVAVRLSPRR